MSDSSRLDMHGVKDSYRKRYHKYSVRKNTTGVTELMFGTRRKNIVMIELGESIIRHRILETNSLDGTILKVETTFGEEADEKEGYSYK